MDRMVNERLLPAASAGPLQQRFGKERVQEVAASSASKSSLWTRWPYAAAGLARADAEVPARLRRQFSRDSGTSSAASTRLRPLRLAW